MGWEIVLKGALRANTVWHRADLCRKLTRRVCARSRSRGSTMSQFLAKVEAIRNVSGATWRACHHIHGRGDLLGLQEAQGGMLSLGQCTVSVAVGCVIISQHLINKEVFSVSLSRRLPETLSSSRGERDLKLNTLEKLNKLDVTYQSSGTP